MVSHFDPQHPLSLFKVVKVFIKWPHTPHFRLIKVTFGSHFGTLGGGQGRAQLKIPLVTRSISSIYRFIVMLVADITDVR